MMGPVSTDDSEVAVFAQLKELLKRIHFRVKRDFHILTQRRVSVGEMASNRTEREVHFLDDFQVLFRRRHDFPSFESTKADDRVCIADGDELVAFPLVTVTRPTAFTA
jgi:arginine deiminase